MNIKLEGSAYELVEFLVKMNESLITSNAETINPVWLENGNDLVRPMNDRIVTPDF